MSQFDFPRINFHGSVLLDVPTGNNSFFAPLRIYNQDEALPFSPPRVYLTAGQIDYVQNTLGFKVCTESNESYVEIDTICDAETFEKWAVCNLGTSTYDSHFKPLYDYIPLDSNPNAKLSSSWVQPGYWNYYGDLSVYAEDIRITGIQVLDANGNVITYTPENSEGCPPGLAQLLDKSFSFHQQFFDPNSRTTAMFCDIDSINDTCTQMFYGNAGIYGKEGTVEKTYFKGSPCKSTFNWLSLSKVLNWNNALLMPMSGGVYFNSTIKLTETDPLLQSDLDQYSGTTVDSLSMKILTHQVYEVHNPDYTKMPTKPLGNNKTDIPKNPARAAFSGSICPFMEGDMTTNNIARILKNEISDNPVIDVCNLVSPTPLGSEKPLVITNKIQLPPAFVSVNTAKKVISLDVINTICEYGTGLGPRSDYGGITSVPPFTGFENFDFGTLSLIFVPDSGFPAIPIGSIDHTNDYNMSSFLARGGVMDFPIPAGIPDFSTGKFQILRDGQVLLTEDNYLILSDQQGSYAEQNQDPSYGYKSDGDNRGPVILRAFYRGEPIPSSKPVSGVYQYPGSTGLETIPFSYYDGAKFEYPTTSQPGCVQYILAITENQKAPTSSAAGLYFAANGYTLTTRVLADAPQLEVYLNGTEPLTFKVLYDNILSNYNKVLPIMNTILPFTESNWSEPYTMRRLAQFTDPKNWGHYMYMPVTRELSKTQQALLQKWANDILNSPS